MGLEQSCRWETATNKLARLGPVRKIQDKPSYPWCYSCCNKFCFTACVCIRSFLNWPASTPSPWCSHALFCSHFLNCAYAATLVRSQASLIDFFAGAQSQNMYWDLHTISSFLLKSKIPLWAGCSGFPSQGAGIHLAGTQSQKRSCQSHTDFSLLKSQMPLWVSLPGFTLQIHANPLIFTFRVATHRLHMLGEVASTLQVTKCPASG